MSSAPAYVDEVGYLGRDGSTFLSAAGVHAIRQDVRRGVPLEEVYERFYRMAGHGKDRVKPSKETVFRIAREEGKL